MFIRCWGARGSIPVSGKEYIKYGGDTTCIEIRSGNGDVIVIDAGTGIRRLGNRLIAERLFNYNFLLTHAHWDHLMGFPFFKPLFLEGTKLVMYQGAFHRRYLERIFSKVMAPPNFPVKYSDLKASIIYKESEPHRFEIGPITIETIAINHPNTGCGYKFTENGKSFVFLTDNELGFVHAGGLTFDAYVSFCRDADLLIHDAEYTRKEYETFIEWGHSTYMDALNLAFESGVRQFGMFHHNQERSDDELDRIVMECMECVIRKNSSLRCFAVGSDMSFNL